MHRTDKKSTPLPVTTIHKYNHNNTQDSITHDVAQLFNMPDEKVTVEMLEEMLRKIQSTEHELTPIEVMYQELLQQQLASRRIRDQIRTG